MKAHRLTRRWCIGTLIDVLNEAALSHIKKHVNTKCQPGKMVRLRMPTRQTALSQTQNIPTQNITPVLPCMARLTNHGTSNNQRRSRLLIRLVTSLESEAFGDQARHHKRLYEEYRDKPKAKAQTHASDNENQPSKKKRIQSHSTKPGSPEPDNKKIERTMMLSDSVHDAQKRFGIVNRISESI